MKKIIDYINETKATEWIAVEITTAGPFTGDKDRVSQRVISGETYDEMMEKGHTKGHAEVKHITKLGPWCKTKDKATEYLDYKEKKVKKGKIKKGDADYIVWCMSIGKMNPAGKTIYDWSIWEEWKPDETEIYIGSKWASASFLIGAKGSLKVGDTVFCVDNDTQKKLSGAPSTIVDVCPCSKEAFQTKIRELMPTQCKRPTRAFGKITDGLPWGKFGQMYSIKGVAEEA